VSTLMQVLFSTPEFSHSLCQEETLAGWSLDIRFVP